MRIRKVLCVVIAICMVLSSVSVAYAQEIPEITETKIVGGVEETVTEDPTAEVKEEAETTVETESVEVKTESTEAVEEETETETAEAVVEKTEEKTEEAVTEGTKAEESIAETKTEETKEAAADIVLTAELDDVIVTLKADADAFDNKGELSLKIKTVEIEDTEDEKALDAVEKENVAKRVTYDITVYDDGEVIEPVKEVKVSFELKDAPSGADGVNIYHHDEGDGIEKIATEVLKEDDKEETVSVGEAKTEVKVTHKDTEITEISEEELADTDDVEIEDDVTSVEATTDSFSLYTVDFTYKDKTISIAGDTTGNKLDDIISQLGIEEDVEEATTYQDAECTEKVASGEVKEGDKTLFSVYEIGNEWYVDAENAFQTEHGLVIKTADGAEYKITVTDAVNGWVEESGGWRYYKDGEPVKNQFCKSGDKYYWLDENGYIPNKAMIIKNFDPKWYCIDDQGALITQKWCYLEGYWYFAQESGVLFKADSGKGHIIRTVNGNLYAFDEEAKLCYGWFELDSEKHYAMNYLSDPVVKNEDGRLAREEWVDKDGYWYYFDTESCMVKNTTKTIQGKDYTFNSEGKLISGTPEKLKVEWWDYKGYNILSRDTVEYGSVPVYKGETPTKPEDSDYYYVFSKWSPDITAVTKNAVYIPEFTATKKISYTVMFDANGHGTAPDSQKVISGGKVTKPTDPTTTGYTFGGWYKESTCTTVWDFENDTVKADTTLYAKWTYNSGSTSSGGGGGGGSVGGSSSGSGITGSKSATTPITVATNGTQVMGTSVASKPIAMFTKEEQKNIYGKGGQTAWTISNGSYQLKDNAGNLVKNRWALVSDNLSTSGIGNVSNFYFDENGNMLIGWQWIKDADGLYRQYFFNNENGPLLGACLMGGTKDGKTLNEKGQVVVNGAVQAFATKPAT